MAYRYSRVMLVDDGEVDNLINKKMMEAVQFAQHVFTHSSAVSAIEFLQSVDGIPEVAKQLLPELLFLDINMPLMDGFQFLDHFDKLSHRVHDACRIVVLTSSPDETYVKEARAHRYVKDYVIKPLSEKSLRQL